MHCQLDHMKRAVKVWRSWKKVSECEAGSELSE